MRAHLFFLPASLNLNSIGVVADWYAQAVDLSVHADTNGWSGVWFAEHHGAPYGGIVPSPELLLAVVAARTTRIRLGFGVAVLPLRHPLAVAEHVGMLDQLSFGRVELGVGRGFLAHEYSAQAIDIKSSWSRFVESLSLLQDGWRTGVMNGTCGGLTINAAHVLPSPLQRPHPPIWIAASRNADTFRFAGANGYNLMINWYTRSRQEVMEGLDWYWSAYHKAGHDPARARVATLQHLYVGESSSEAALVPKDGFLSYISSVQEAFARSEGQAREDNPEVGKVLSRITAVSYQSLLDERVSFGTPAEILCRIRDLAKLGFTDVLYMPQFGTLDWATASLSVSRFEKQIMEEALAIRPAGR